ncbi:unnamed protein product [Thlaspi arvense]|uniref:Uncharacterized protein n=1 Tax=Thlaspi arvense TaxID=13288 RepID=A0AAU9S743_THLAR|nr:unnamed protein product [Thlaspi arvense]
MASFPLVGNLTKLTVLKLSYNHFSGTLNSKSSLFELLELSLAFNNFSSSLPFEFGNLNKLETLSLSSNGFFGQVPPTISNLTQITMLILGQNTLTGRFPLVQNLTKLSLISFYGNHFYGTIPSVLTLPFLAELDLHGNQFNGSIEHLNSSSLSRLELLYLGNIDLEGKILEPISKFTTLKSLDLSFLKTSYPMDLSLLSSFKFLEWLDISDVITINVNDRVKEYNHEHNSNNTICCTTTQRQYSMGQILRKILRNEMTYRKSDS